MPLPNTAMNKYLTSAFVFTGILLGGLIALQFRTNVPAGNTFVADEVEAKEALFDEFLDEQAYLQDRVTTLREEIDKIQSEIKENSQESNIKLLDSLKYKVGLTEIRGKGLKITLSDSPFAYREGAEVTDNLLVQASDLRDIVNIVKASNANAVSINGQRIIATSPISAVGTKMLVNNSYISPPFIISAVGDTDTMLQRLLNEPLLPSIYERSSQGDIVFKIAIKERITVPIYNGNLKVDRLSLVE